MPTYTETDTQIIRENEDGSISYIPKNEFNSDYQAYLNPKQNEGILN